MPTTSDDKNPRPADNQTADTSQASTSQASTSQASTSQAWGGRFREQTAAIAQQFSASVQTDKTLADADLRGSRAHAAMLVAQGILTPEDGKAIAQGLSAIEAEIEAGTFVWDPSLEDVHMNIEAALTQRIGKAGGRLHTGRSRNDQVATDMRLWVRGQIDALCVEIDQLLRVLHQRASDHCHALMPGYTHLQRAQPIRLAHHLLAWMEMLERDRGRLSDARKRLNECPLGAGALAATTFPLDRMHTSEALGFDRPSANSLETVGDRDFLVEVLAALANCAVHLSRFGEELVLWSSQEFGFVRMSDAFSTGSSMMPQKRNPDMAELVRGKAGGVVGDLVSLLVMLKGLPLAYNRDLQEDKAPVFRSMQAVRQSVVVMSGMMATLEFRDERMRAALGEGHLLATEVADYLAERGVPFREAHHVAGRLVAQAEAEGTSLEALPLAAFRAQHARFDKDVFAVLNHERAVERRALQGGPGLQPVQQALGAWSERLQARPQQPPQRAGDTS